MSTLKMRLSILVVLTFTCFAFALASTQQDTKRTIVLTEEGLRIHADSLVIDGHNDLPWQLRQRGDMSLTRYNLTRYQSRFQSDIPRMREGGVGAQFWAAYTPSSTQNSGTSYEMCKEQVDLIARMIEKYDAFYLAKTTEDIRAAREAGKIASIIAIEGGHAIENSLDKLREFYDLGVRYMTLTHNGNVDWADSATDSAEHGGLTDFGRDVVREMNRLGMLVDISHVSADTMRDVLDVATAPVIASHSGAYAIRRHNRNVPDDVLSRIADNGGVVMVVFYKGFVVSGGSADVDDVIDHIDHIVETAGIDHVGIGSDFDGAPTWPNQLKDTADFPYLTQGLLDRGYSEEEIKKILGENLMRAFAEAERVAGK